MQLRRKFDPLTLQEVSELHNQVKKKEKREFLRLKIKQLTSIITNEQGNYELIEESATANPSVIRIHDISLGGVCITIDQKLREEALIDLEIPKVFKLGPEVITCEVTRSVFKVVERKHYYEVGLKFKERNIDYLKQFIELAKTNTIMMQT